VEANQQSIEVVIADSGCGMDSRVLERLMKGVPCSTKSNGQGLGVLSTKTLIESVGGTLKMVPHPNGTRVVVTLPRRRSPRWFFDPTTIPSRQVIALDDDPTIKDRLQSFFSGREIEFYEREEDFLKRVKETPEALPLVDLHFGGKRDGIQLILEEKLSCRAVLVSGRISFDDQVRQRAIENQLRLFPKECMV
jgi:hypothetical protein